MPVPVPQFIKEETKIMGVITFTQLTVLVIGFGFLVFLYFTIDLKIWWIFAAIGAPIVMLVAFGQIEGIPLIRLLPYIFRHFWLPKNYLWIKEKEVISSSLQPTQKEETQVLLPKKKKELDKNILEQLSKYLDE